MICAFSAVGMSVSFFARKQQKTREPKGGLHEQGTRRQSERAVPIQYCLPRLDD